MRFLEWAHGAESKSRLFLTVPHSGEWIPPEAPWLLSQPQSVLLTDIDRFVDVLYRPAVDVLKIPMLSTKVHRYVVDLNRVPEDIDVDSVEGASHPSGKFKRGFHWSASTREVRLMPKPISQSLHEEICKKYFVPFHQEIVACAARLKTIYPDAPIYHLDCHSMPSQGTAAHRDVGQKRADVVVSDLHGTSAKTEFKDLVIDALKSMGLTVAYNFPYFGGRITEVYGKPMENHHTLQIELNRGLYMNEVTREPLQADFETLAAKLVGMLTKIKASV
jgi:N-formylglutamate deformylase